MSPGRMTVQNMMPLILLPEPARSRTAPDSDTDNLKVSCAPNALLMVNCVADLMGKEDTEKFRERVAGGAEMAKRISPIPHLGKHTPPTLILDGDQDRWFEMAKTFVDKLQSLGMRAEL